jgi:hypothetical protein
MTAPDSANLAYWRGRADALMWVYAARPAIDEVYALYAVCERMAEGPDPLAPSFDAWKAARDAQPPHAPGWTEEQEP